MKSEFDKLNRFVITEDMMDTEKWMTEDKFITFLNKIGVSLDEEETVTDELLLVEEFLNIESILKNDEFIDFKEIFETHEYFEINEAIEVEEYNYWEDFHEEAFDCVKKENFENELECCLDFLAA